MKIEAIYEEAACKKLFETIMHVLGFDSYEVSSCGNNGYMIRPKSDKFLFPLIYIQGHDACANNNISAKKMKMLSVQCVFSNLYCSLVEMLIDASKKCWKNDVFLVFSSRGKPPEEICLAEASSFVGYELAIEIDMMAAWREKHKKHENA